jgi:glyoxylase-like metal-dependent hydrolase (beta-lactamase superfamily II)
LALLAAATPRAGAQQPTARALSEPWPEIVKVDGIEILHVQKGVYMLVGGGANVTVQIGQEGVTLVNAGAPGQGEKIVAAVRHLTRKPLRYLVNTSADADNAGGNGAMVKAAGGTNGAAGAGGGTANTGILIISHENALNRMIKGTPAFPALTGDALPESSFFTPKKDVYANGEAVQILYQPKAHSDGDVIVFFRGSDVISTGDIFRTDSYPVIEAGGTIQGELNALNTILDITVPERNQIGGTRIIPGRGRIGNEADVLEYRDMVTIIRDRVRDMVRKNMTLEQVKAAKPMLEYDGIYGTRKEWTGAMFLETIYKELAKKP